MVRPTLRHYVHELNNVVGGLDVDESLVISEGRDYLLGVWTAAWPGKPDAILGTARGLDQSVSVPVGIGLVVPGYKILQILDRDDLQTERWQAMAKDRSGKTPVPTRAGGNPKPSRRRTRLTKRISRLLYARPRNRNPKGDRTQASASAACCDDRKAP